jgi:ABC-2 type transport system ATP-binding protein
METVIEIRGLTKTYGTVRALDGLTLSIPRGGV